MLVTGREYRLSENVMDPLKGAKVKLLDGTNKNVRFKLLEDRGRWKKGTVMISFNLNLEEIKED